MGTYKQLIVNNSDTCFINIYGVLACTPTLFTIYSAYCLVGTLTWLLSRWPDCSAAER